MGKQEEAPPPFTLQRRVLEIVRQNLKKENLFLISIMQIQKNLCRFTLQQIQMQFPKEQYSLLFRRLERKKAFYHLILFLIKVSMRHAIEV
ncbi:MAG: hypothetical protein COX62_05665 [Deltaproteobacteria bacterium CG_4_10_14_0_2_um_filter_43_8]|nr:MAG: hypothetical protein COV43_08270 [Deltaproteobacteria bacterium CG11_big_fil_rev_8_21_14_0_20_42_23]PJA19928.1 MAG: hypothetical protein COX62_05665 [Deltaproteobacteria bacterium CG_4_10_14_0_2_um_filter_43_8]PJC63723.1 MAG: hypothetical protein CO021_08025 [Deltaproteobacteria bacterium CG_4_9_14_0_2_um_filter_42_21]